MNLIATKEEGGLHPPSTSPMKQNKNFKAQMSPKTQSKRNALLISAQKSTTNNYREIFQAFESLLMPKSLTKDGI